MDTPHITKNPGSIALLLVLLMYSPPATARDTCFTSFGRDEVVVRTRSDLQFCNNFFTGLVTVYTVEPTAGRSQIEGCLISHVPEGYTSVFRSRLSCAPGDVVTWFRNNPPAPRGYLAAPPVNTPFIGTAETSDPDNDSLRYTTSSPRVNLNPTTGALTYTPPPSFRGGDFFSVQATDGKGGSASIFFEVNVGGPPAGGQAPIFPSFPLQIPQASVAGFRLSATDPEGSPVVILLDPAFPPQRGTLVPLPSLGKDSYLYKPDPAYSGTDSFAARAFDAVGNVTRTTFSVRVVPLEPTGDADLDGMPNAYELSKGFNPHDAGDASKDADLDGLTNLEEFRAGTDPFTVNPEGDADRDGMPNGYELSKGLNPSDARDAAADPDMDGLSNLAEFLAGSDPFAIDPNGDIDRDGLPNGFEVANGLNPRSNADAGIDSDRDGVSNLDEFRAGSDPRNVASTPDSVRIGKILQPILDLLLE